MRKAFISIAIMCMLAVAAMAFAGCGSSEPSKSSSSEEKLVVNAEPTQSSSSDTVETKPVYMLAIGNDSRFQTAEDKKGTIQATDPSFSDTIMLMRLDPQNNSIAIASIPRDTATEIEGQPFKINDVHYAGGPNALCQFIGDMFGVEIPYYYDLKFVDFAALVDRIGGVTLEVPMALSGKDEITGESVSVGAGENTLNGHEALMVVRQRKVYSNNGEAIRQQISRELVSGTIQAWANKPASEAAEAVSILESFGETNMPDDVLTAYIAAFMNNEGEIAFNMGSAPYEGGIDSTGAWRIANDPDMYAQMHAAMESGAPLTDLVPNPL